MAPALRSVWFRNSHNAYHRFSRTHTRSDLAECRAQPESGEPFAKPLEMEGT
jgi:hypothetical protein